MRDGLTFGWLSSPDGHLDCVDDELTADVIGDRPAHDSAAERVEHDREIHLAGVGRVLGDVHHPQAIWCIDVEDTIHEVVGQVVLWITSRAAPVATPIDTCDARFAHQSLDPLTRTERVLSEPQLRVHARRPIGPA
jgi:hypothetical protein